MGPAVDDPLAKDDVVAGHQRQREVFRKMEAVVLLIILGGIHSRKLGSTQAKLAQHTADVNHHMVVPLFTQVRNLYRRHLHSPPALMISFMVSAHKEIVLQTRLDSGARSRTMISCGTALVILGFLKHSMAYPNAPQSVPQQHRADAPPSARAPHSAHRTSNATPRTMRCSTLPKQCRQA